MKFNTLIATLMVGTLHPVSATTHSPRKAATKAQMLLLSKLLKPYLVASLKPMLVLLMTSSSP